MLIPELDKLRNKELSFGCVIENAGKSGYIIQAVDKGLAIIVGLRYWVGNRTAQVNAIDRDWIIGHPLTWGRIRWRYFSEYGVIKKKLEAGANNFEELNNKINGLFTVYSAIIDIEDDNIELLDQNELQRMQHEKRPELRELLIQFSNYI